MGFRSKYKEGNNGGNKGTGQGVHAIHGGADWSYRRNCIFSSGIGKMAFGLGSIALLFLSAASLKMKPLEGKVALGAQPAVMKLIGLLWRWGLGRCFLWPSFVGKCFRTNGQPLSSVCNSLVGFLMSSIAASKNAIWKA